MSPAPRLNCPPVSLTRFISADGLGQKLSPNRLKPKGSYKSKAPKGHEANSLRARPGGGARALATDSVLPARPPPALPSAGGDAGHAASAHASRLEQGRARALGAASSSTGMGAGRAQGPREVATHLTLRRSSLGAGGWGSRPGVGGQGWALKTLCHGGRVCGHPRPRPQGEGRAPSPMTGVAAGSSWGGGAVWVAGECVTAPPPSPLYCEPETALKN